MKNDDFDGGFPSLDGMLQWAIGHSDLAKLKETAESVQQLSLDKLKIRQLEIKVLELGGLTKLMTMVKSSFLEEAREALFSVSALIRNSLDGQELFNAETGDEMLQEILSNSSIDITVRRKSVFLVAGLAESQLGTRNKAGVEGPRCN
ncbi:uncharacterized protein LOC130779325 isoform X2 [Actinidia eriantha]|uniref:uncharacterized protein LOC130779325 isoform X2 n=1 Tax=Actinidia eriantha TaxID=165200 RepID=UPI0025838EE0|nr:uncharacterized protein LOC130779325 isoform X2 [Actinidia eriantha]